MRLEDIIFVVDSATVKDVDEGRSHTLLSIYNDFITEFSDGETVLNPEMFIGFWKKQSYLEKIRFLADYGY